MIEIFTNQEIISSPFLLLSVGGFLRGLLVFMPLVSCVSDANQVLLETVLCFYVFFFLLFTPIFWNHLFYYFCFKCLSSAV